MSRLRESSSSLMLPKRTDAKIHLHQLMNWTALLEMLSQIAIKGSIMLIAALLAGMLSRKLAAARRCSIWITALIALAVLPAAIWLLPDWRVLPKPHDLDWPNFEAERPVTMEPARAPALPAPSALLPSLPTSPLQTSVLLPALPESAASWQPFVEALPVIWLAVVILFLLRLAWSVWHLFRLERSLSDGRCELLSFIAKDSGLKRLPRLLIGPSDAVPMVWGVFRPRLLMPDGFQSWPEAKLRGVLLHELAHLQRGDPVALWLAQWVKALHWFNPLAWMTVGQLRADQERACDDAALRQGLRPSDYAQHLLDLSRHTRVAPGLALYPVNHAQHSCGSESVGHSQPAMSPRRPHSGLGARPDGFRPVHHVAGGHAPCH